MFLYISLKLILAHKRFSIVCSDIYIYIASGVGEGTSGAAAPGGRVQGAALGRKMNTLNRKNSVLNNF